MSEAIYSEVITDTMSQVTITVYPDGKITELWEIQGGAVDIALIYAADRVRELSHDLAGLSAVPNPTGVTGSGD